jgi:hypothetical protein
MRIDHHAADRVLDALPTDHGRRRLRVMLLAMIAPMVRAAAMSIGGIVPRLAAAAAICGVVVVVMQAAFPGLRHAALL